jgi:hypothetical protein
MFGKKYSFTFKPAVWLDGALLKITENLSFNSFAVLPIIG